MTKRDWSRLIAGFLMGVYVVGTAWLLSAQGFQGWGAFLATVGCISLVASGVVFMFVHWDSK
jgi:uncharacterized membrane protein (UPF0136 family)